MPAKDTCPQALRQGAVGGLYGHDTAVSERLDLIDAIGSSAPHAVNGRDNMRMLRAAGKDCRERGVSHPICSLGRVGQVDLRAGEPDQEDLSDGPSASS